MLTNIVTLLVSNPDGAEVSYKWPACKMVSQMRAVFSYVVVILMWLSALSSIGGVFSTGMGVYQLIVAIPITALEFNKIFANFCKMFPEDGKFCHYWRIVMQLDGWKRGLLYLVIAFPMFIPGFTGAFAFLVGLALFVLGLLYVATKFAVVTFTIPPPTDIAQAAGQAAYSANLQQQQGQFTSISTYNNP